MTLNPAVARKAIDEAIRNSFFLFLLKVFETLHPDEPLVHGWHLQALCFALEQVREGVVKRLLITMPPRHLKSVCGSVAYPAWVLAHNPATKIVCVSYGQELGIEHAGNFRRVIASDWYRRIFPDVVITRNTELIVTTSAGGNRRTTTLQGALTGLGADLVIIDDLMKAQDATSAIERERTHNFMTHTLVPRLNSKRTGAIIVVGQRLHEDDLPGHLLLTCRYTTLNLPAIAVEDTTHQIGSNVWHHRCQGEALCPERESVEDLDGLRLEMGSRNFEAQYQQNPGASDSGLLDWKKVKFYEEALSRNRYESVIQSWDTGFTADARSDYSVGATVGYRDGVWHLLDLVRGQWGYPALKREVLAAQAKWRADIILIERTGAGLVLIEDFWEQRRLAETRGERQGFKIRSYTPKGVKETRFSGQVDKIEAGRLLFPKAALWLPDLRKELLAFPEGRHDDQVDAISQFLHWLVESGFHARLDREEFTRRRNPERRETFRRNIVRR